jgi:TonB family protein
MAASKQEAGESGEAEAMFARALEVADRTLGPDDPDVVLLLTDLSRLYLKKSAFASAEPLLLRLFEIKRSKGDDHPEVATVLASLATVRQALGRHESAEQLWRRVLDIRDRTLAPNHFAIATSLEHLGDSCAARGKIAEALSAFQRALSIREKTMGVDHPSLRPSRERIADLRLQGSEDSFDVGTPLERTVAPEKYRLLAGESPRLTLSEPPAWTPPTPAPLERSNGSNPKKPPVSIQARFDDLIAASDRVDVATSPAASPAGAMTVILPHPTDPQGEPLTYLNALESLRDEMEKPYPTTLSERGAEMVSAAMLFLRRKEAIVGAAAVGLGLLSLAVVTDSQASGERDPAIGVVSAAGAEPLRTSPRPAAASLPIAQPPAPTVTAPENSINSTVNHPRPTEDRAPISKRTPEKKIDIKPPTIPALSTAVISGLDSAVSRAGNVSAQVTNAMFAPGPVQALVPRSGLEVSQTTEVPLRARLIGDLPTPRVPAQVADVEGEVRVRFSVDAEGHPMMSTIEVLNSPNPLLANAVRKVIPAMRFEPARTGGPNPKPIADLVQIGFQFSKGR